MSVIDDDESGRTYKVVVNTEEQYSIWPAARECPSGWAATGVGGSRAECLEYIEKTWTDMRPRSLRVQMDNVARPHAED